MFEVTLKSGIFNKYYAENLRGGLLNNLPKFRGDRMNGVVNINA